MGVFVGGGGCVLACVCAAFMWVRVSVCLCHVFVCACVCVCAVVLLVICDHSSVCMYMLISVSASMRECIMYLLFRVRVMDCVVVIFVLGMFKHFRRKKCCLNSHYNRYIIHQL